MVFNGERNFEGFFSCSVLSYAAVQGPKIGIGYITKYIMSDTR